MMISRAAILPVFALAVMINTSFAASFKTADANLSDSIYLADPTIFYDQGTYYLYGTGSDKGFPVYTSKDLKTWKGPAGKKKGLALLKGDSYGTQGFWAPQVFKHNNKFYMAYTANEHIAIAESDSPLGPFIQHHTDTVSGNGKQIDPYVFIDDDEKKYLYHVRLNKGNRLYVAEMKDDFSDIKPETVRECLSAVEPWENTENTEWPVSEGPTVIKRGKLYYMFYSANDFRNINYAVGYAVSETPYGPWKKHAGNPIISKGNIGFNGSGHGDLLKTKKGDFYYVLHTHKSDSKVSPRKTGIVKIKFVKNGSDPDKVIIQKGSFSFLKLLP